MNENFTKENKYEQTLTVPCYCTDVNSRLKPSAFMDIMQELAYLGATKLHFGYDQLHEHNTAWVLSRMHFTFNNPPKWRDVVKLETWHKGLEGLFFLRDFRMLDAQGNPLLACTSSWLVINTETRRMVRSDAMTGIVFEEGQCKENAIEEPAPKVMMPRGVEAEKVAEHKVAYSDVDLIGHTNNVRYVVWAMDCIDYQELITKGVKDVKINFNKETLPGDVVEIYKLRIQEEDKVKYLIEGKVNGLSAFCTEISL